MVKIPDYGDICHIIVVVLIVLIGILMIVFGIPEIISVLKITNQPNFVLRGDETFLRILAAYGITIAGIIFVIFGIYGLIHELRA